MTLWVRCASPTLAARLRARLLVAASCSLPLYAAIACSSSSAPTTLGGNAGATGAAGAGGFGNGDAAGAAGTDAAGGSIDAGPDGGELACPPVLHCVAGVSCQCAIVCYTPGGGQPPPLPCLAFDAPTLRPLLNDALSTPPNAMYAEITAGPSETGGHCCYVAVWPTTGRPLEIDANHRVSKLVRRADWTAARSSSV